MILVYIVLLAVSACTAALMLFVAAIVVKASENETDTIYRFGYRFFSFVLGFFAFVIILLMIGAAINGLIKGL